MEWNLKSQPVPPPSIIKQRTVRNYARRFGIATLVESGTFLGDMVYAQRNNFKEIFSIEISEHLYDLAKRRFAHFDHIHIEKGDSAQLIREIIKGSREPWLFWLDAHCSGGITGKGETDTPVIDEVRTILLHEIKNHVILIDDARDFDGFGDYPSIETFRSMVKKMNPECAFDVQHDIIRLHTRKHT